MAFLCYSAITWAQVPPCATLIRPADASTDNSCVPIFTFVLDTPITENYHVILNEPGMMPDTLLNAEVADSDTNSWAFFNLDTNTLYEWRVVPFNATGPAAGCAVWTFRTQAAPTLDPVTCSAGQQGIFFEEEFSGTAPAGWTGDISSTTNEMWDVVQTGGTTSTNTGPSAAFSGTHYAYFESSTNAGHNDTSALITPAIDLSASTDDVELEFYYHSFIFSFRVPDSDVGSLTIEATSDTTGGGTWTLLDKLTESYTSNINQPWRPVQLNLGSGFNGGDVYIRFTAAKAHPDDFNVDMAIDRVRVKTCQACPDPSDGMAFNETAVGADLTWTDNAMAGLWDLEIDTAGFTPTGTPTVSLTSDNPYTWTGGMAETDYEFYVRSQCDEGATQSDWAGPFPFTTLCATQIADYCQDFETFPLGQMNGNLIECWINTNTVNPEWVANTGGTVSGGTGPTGANTGSNYIYLETSSPAAADESDTLTGPSVDISGLTTPQLSYFYHMHGEGMGNLRCEISDNGGAWTLLNQINGEQQAVQADPWLQHTEDLSAYTGPVQVRFIGITGPDTVGFVFEGDIGLDDICIQETPLCPDPSALTAINVMATSVTLDWTPGGTEMEWIVSYGPLGTGAGMGTVMSEAQDSSDVMGLMAGTNYTAYVRAFCDPDSSDWVGPLNFSTLFPNDTCSEAISITCDSTVLFNNLNSRSFTGPTCITSTGEFGLWYKLTGDGSEVTISTDNPGTDHDTKLLVYTEGCDSLECVTGDDDGGTGTTSQLSFISEVGREYLIYACGFDDNQGSIEMSITCTTCFAPDYSLSVDYSSCPSNDILVDITTLGSATTWDITNSLNASNVSGAGIGEHTLTGFGLNDTVTVYLTDSGDPTCVDSMTIITASACPPANDECTGAVTLMCGDSLSGQTTLNATGGSSTSCLGTQGNNVWYTIAGNDQEITVSVMTDGVLEAQIDIYESADGTCDSITCLTGAGSGENPVSATFLSVTGTTYYISVGSWINGDPDGDFGIKVDCENCYDPSNLAVIDIEDDRAKVTWDHNPNASGFHIEFGPDGFVLGTGTVRTTGTPGGPRTLAVLMPNTDYDVYLWEICDGANSDTLGPISFTTLCEVLIPDYMTDYSTFLPDCWTEASGGTPATGPTGIGGGVWIADDFRNSTSDPNGQAARINIFSTTQDDWLISPTFDLSGGPYNLIFDFASTDFADTFASDWGSDDEFQLLASTDDGATWTNVMTWTDANKPSAAGDNIVIDISAFTGNTIFAFWGSSGTVDDTEDVDVFVDNFEISLSSPCPPVLNLSGNQADETYQASTTINSTATVTSGVVDYKAGSEINLNADFEVQSGAEFNATIEDCP